MRKEWNIVGKWKIFIGISCALMLVGILCNIILGVQLDIDFKGGTLLKYSYTGTIDSNEVEEFLTDTLDGRNVEVTLATDGNTAIINVSLAEKLDLDTTTALEGQLAEQYADNQIELVDSQSLDPVMGRLFFIKCLVAIALACVFLLVYIALRFRKIGGLSAAVMAIVALLHDILIAYFTFIIFRIPLNDNFVAVVLTILGYSLNGTIVIFDRIRENRRLMDPKTPIAELVNTSINQSLVRSFNTSLCTFAAIAIVAIMALVTGLDSIISFAVPMMFGILSGFYTSTFLCCPLWVIWVQHRDKKQAEKKASRKKGSKKSRA